LRQPFRYAPLLSLGSIVFLTALWQVAVSFQWLDERLWPSPWTITLEMWTMITTGQLHPHIWATLVRVLWSFGVGSLAGIVLGLAMGMVRPLRAIFDPLISVLAVLPKIAILPLVYLAFGGYGELPRMVTVGIGVFAVMVINSMGAVGVIDGVLIEAGRNFGAHWRQMFWQVLLPGALPSIFSGLRVAASTALLVVIAAEFSYTDEGLGFLIWSSWNTLATTRMFVGLICIALLGVFFTIILRLAERIFIPWKKRG
jgi:NitT/TauT family transport system permease protein